MALVQGAYSKHLDRVCVRHCAQTGRRKGSAVFFATALALVIGFGFEWVANQELSSWDELQRREGVLVKVHRPPRNQRHSNVVIRDEEGNEHSYLGWMHGGIEKQLKQMTGEKIIVSSRPYVELWPPFYYQSFEKLEGETSAIIEPRASPAEEKASQFRLVRGCFFVFLVFIAWIIKLYGREARIQQKQHVQGP